MEELKDIALGTSFSPEYTEYIYSGDALDILKTIHKELNISEFRFGLRWNSVEQDSNISLSFYKKYLEYAFKEELSLCLNIGPIKTFRWPEEHIPKYLESKSLPVITEECELAKYAYEFLHKELSLLKKEYGKNLSKCTFQIENEGFNKFGHLGLIMSNEYMYSIAKILNEYFPKNKLMIDSAGRQDLREIVSFFKMLIEEKLYTGKNLVLGFNYYFKPEGLMTDIFRYLNPVKYALPFAMSIPTLHKFQKEIGFDMEITEGQFEPWGKEKTPGNTYYDFVYLLENSYVYFPENMKRKVLRLWGTEELASKIKNRSLTSEHIQIIDHVRRING